MTQRLTLDDVERIALAALTRAGASHLQSAAEAEGSRGIGLGQSDHTERIETMLTAMTAEAGVRIPGDRQHANRRVAEQDGVTVDETFATVLCELAGSP